MLGAKEFVRRGHAAGIDAALVCEPEGGEVCVAQKGAIRMLVYRINFANPAADRYSRLAVWQVHKTRQELDATERSQVISRKLK